MTIETVGRPFGIQVFDVLPLGAKPTLIAKIIRFEESLRNLSASPNEKNFKFNSGQLLQLSKISRQYKYSTFDVQLKLKYTLESVLLLQSLNSHFS